MASKGQEASIERPIQRQCIGRLKQAEIATFEDLNNDCLVCILKFLETEAMNDATLINSHFYEARKDPSLDQTRTAIIICKSKNMNMNDLYETIATKRWARRFFGHESNMKCLKIIGLEVLSDDLSDTRMIELHSQSVDVQLQSVTSLKVSFDPSEKRAVKAMCIPALVRILPNLLEVDMSYVKVYSGMLMMLYRKFRNLTCIRWNGSDAIFVYPGQSCINNPNITELHVDGSLLVDRSISPVISAFNVDLSDHQRFLWRDFPGLERLSMKNTMWSISVNEPLPISQEMLIKLVRHHPTLRWLCSDLTDENIAMLKRSGRKLHF